MIAIILAAGEGSRLQPYTVDRPKCMVQLAGRPIIMHQLEALRVAGVTDVTIITGYRAEQIRRLRLPTRHNSNYTTTNMVASLMCAADLLDGSNDVLVTYADIVYEPRLIAALQDCNAPLCTAVDTSWLRLWQLRMDNPLEDAETLHLDTNGNICEIGNQPKSCDDIHAQYIGLVKLRAGAARGFVEAYQQIDCGSLSSGLNRDTICMTRFLQYLIDKGTVVKAVPISGGWLEVDSVGDLETYNNLHVEGRLAEFCDLRVCTEAGMRS